MMNVYDIYTSLWCLTDCELTWTFNWSKTSAGLIYPNSANTVADCQNACIANETCKAIEFHLSKNGSRCSLYMRQDGALVDSIDSIFYLLSRPAAPCGMGLSS